MTPAQTILFNRVADKSDQLVAERRKARELKKHLRDLTATVSQCLAALDAEMKEPSTVQRGSRIANISNALNLQNDIAMRFGLGKRS